MSFLSPHHRREDDAPAAGPGQDSAALNLLDDCWFFSNTLAVSRDSSSKSKMKSKPPMLPRSPSTSIKSKVQEGSGTSRFYASGRRRLLRTPSLPSPRVRTMDMMSGKQDEDDDQEQEEQSKAAAAANQEQQEAEAEAEVDDDDLNWSSIYEGVLRSRTEGSRRSSSLQRAPSMPPVQEHHAANSNSSTPRLRHSHSTLAAERHSHTPTNCKHHQADRTPKKTPAAGSVRSFSASQQPVVVMSRSKSAFHDKKWKSSSDLESIEVQGFKDLGFVFDKEELRENLAAVLPGLRSGNAHDSDNGNKSAASDGGVQRPYLSEAWHHPALETRSAAEMKDQLRIWAQAVACNVRHER